MLLHSTGETNTSEQKSDVEILDNLRRLYPTKHLFELLRRPRFACLVDDIKDVVEGLVDFPLSFGTE